MQRIYDIVVNFTKYPYEFYEWETSDNITLIKEIYSFKVDDKTLFDIINNEVIFNKKFLSLIEKNTKYYSKNQAKTIKYACILHNDTLAVALMINDNGLIIRKSRLLFDEEEEIIKSSNNLINISYKIVKKIKINKKLTRKDNEKLKIILEYLNKIYTNKKKEEINYIYYECFDKKQKDYVKAYNLIKHQINLGNYIVINKIKTIIKV